MGLLIVEPQCTSEPCGEFMIEAVGGIGDESGSEAGNLKSERSSDFDSLADWFFGEAHTAFERVE